MYDVVIYRDEEIYLETDLRHVTTTIGKSEDSMIVLKGWNISKQHASFKLSDNDLFIQDEGSMFGTYVNAERVIRYGPVKNSDVITIGPYSLSVVRITEDASSSRSASSTPAGFVVNATTDQSVQASVVRSRLNEAKQSVEPPLEVQKKSHSVVEGNGSHSEVSQAAGKSAALVDLALPTAKIASESSNFAPTKRIRTDRDIEFDRWRKFVHEAVLHEMDVRRIDANRLHDEELRANVRLIIREVIQTIDDLPKHVDSTQLAVEVLHEAIGLGPLEPLLADDSVTEIMVNKFDEIWIETKGQLFLSNATFTSDSAVLGAIERIVTPLGRRIDESSPMVDARLKDGSRVNSIIAPLSLRGPTLTIRKFSKKKITSDDYIAYKSLTPEMVKVLIAIVQLRLNVIISGGTGTGKTSFLNMISSYIAEDERIVTIEDAAELKLHQPNLVSLESRPANLEGKGAISIRDLVRNSLRMRPDRIIVGECRGGEALDMLQAMNTGHDGSMTTLHSNSPRDALARLEVLVLMAGMNLPVRAIREQIASAVHVIVQLTRFSCGARKVTSISEIVGTEGEVIQTSEIFRFKKTGKDAEGSTVGVFEYSGIKPDFMRRMED